jgi:hypothetical protein
VGTSPRSLISKSSESAFTVERTAPLSAAERG